LWCSTGRELLLPPPALFLAARRPGGPRSAPAPARERGVSTRRVRQVVALLPEADREVLILRVYEGLPYDDVAGILGIEPAAARKRHGRALLKLHALLTEHGLTDLLS